MFLGELYRHSKIACIAVCGFLLAYLFLNIKWGIVAAPIFQYGMYSAPQHLSDTQSVYIVNYNGRQMNFGQLNFTQRDIVQLSLLYFEKQDEVNESVFRTMHRFLGFTGLMQHDKFVNHISQQDFRNWYVLKLEDIMMEKCRFVEVQKQNFIWNNNSLMAAGEPAKLIQFAPQ